MTDHDTDGSRLPTNQLSSAARMRADLEIARQCEEVALAIVAEINKVVPNANDRAAVVRDLVNKWRGLGPAEQATYLHDDSPLSPLARFAWTTIDEINAAPFAGLDETSDLPEQLSDALHQRHWSQYIERLHRSATGFPV